MTRIKIVSEKSLLLVVDDEPINIEIFEEALEENYSLEFAETGERCLEKLNTLSPELILMDVNMPGMGGIEACKQIKSNPELSHIPVIFVSALGLPEERASGYRAGGEDYITKPFEEDELLTKIELILGTLQEKSALQQNHQEAMSMAMTAMTQAGEMGEVMHFTRDSFHCATLESLAQRLLESLEQFELESTIRMTLNKTDYFFSSSGIVGGREEIAMEHVREKGRFLHFGKRTVINFQNISVLIKNMPVNEEEKYGRLNDITGMLIEGADARIVGIEMSSSLVTLIKTTRDVLAEIELSRKASEQKSTEILDDLVNSVEWSFINIDLSEQQEDYFRELLNHAKEQSAELFHQDILLEKKIADLINLLSQST